MILNVFPHSRDKLSCGLLESEKVEMWTRGWGTRIAHAKVAKDANPTTLLTRFVEELRRAPEAGPDAGRGRRVV